MSKIENTSVSAAEILIAEDSPTQAARIKYILESYQYKVMVTRNGQEALEWLSKNKPSIVISDIVMPEMNGFKLCEKIKSDESTKDIPVILLTSLSDPHEVIEGLLCGADSFITKPYNKDYLISNIEKILSEKTTPELKREKFVIEINFSGEQTLVRTDPQLVVKFLLNIYEGAIYQNNELIKTQDELKLLNERLEELVDQRTTELINANKELAFQNEEKEKRAAKLVIANRELVFQNEEKEKRAAELVIANKELEFQNEEKEKLAFELIIANKELLFQNEEKEKRAKELIIANEELVFQHKEKEKRAAELIIADKELVFQNEEKEKREAANKELEAFSYSVSHDLRAPLRHIGGFVELLKRNNSDQLDETGLKFLNTISESTIEMGNLIDALLTFSRLSSAELQRTIINSKNLVTRVLKTFSDEIAGRNVEINISELPDIKGDETLINQVWVNLVSNALKYSRNKEKAVIDIGGKIENGKAIFFIKDNGAGFNMKYADKLFGVFQRLHKTRDFEGIGIGLANVNRIVTRHGGKCWAESEVNNGATFFFSLPID